MQFAFLLMSNGKCAASGWYWQNPLPQGNPLNAVAMLNAETVITVGDMGTVLKTSDGGMTWTSQPSGTTNHLRGLSFSDADVGTAVDERGR